MEILSIGEKIKRSRVYKGITLKDLCEDKISMSKMSCIENNKIKPDEDILKFVAEKLGLSYNYLKQDIREQIQNNMKQLESYTGQELEKGLEFNLEQATRYGYYDLSLYFIHKLFVYYLNNGMYDKLEEIIPNYYELYQQDLDAEQQYYGDMGTYFFEAEEYLESITYFDKLINESYKFDFKHCDLAKYLLYQSISYSSLRHFDKSFYYINKAVEIVEEVKDEKIKGQIYAECLCLNLLITNTFDKNCYDKMLVYLKSYDDILSETYLKVAKIYFSKENVSKYYEYIEDAINLRASTKDYKYANFLIKCIEVFLLNDDTDNMEKIVDKALNLAIILDNIKLIDKAYYYKSYICGKKHENRQMEMYMNLSMDALMKFGTPRERYKRYLQMGQMYSYLQDLQEAIKYFTLADEMVDKL